MTDKKTTLVIGASEKPERYSNMAIKALRKHGYPVVAVGLREGQLDDVLISKNYPTNVRVDTITLYLNPNNQIPHYQQILSLNPRRIIFNPGTENPTLIQLAEEAGIESLEACTLVLLSTDQY
jgi:predicted CoA-binding protein